MDEQNKHAIQSIVLAALIWLACMAFCGGSIGIVVWIAQRFTAR